MEPVSRSELNFPLLSIPTRETWDWVQPLARLRITYSPSLRRLSSPMDCGTWQVFDETDFQVGEEVIDSLQSGLRHGYSWITVMHYHHRKLRDVDASYYFLALLL